MKALAAAAALALAGPAGAAGLEGLYRAPDGHAVAVVEFAEFGPQRLLVDYGSGEAGVLFPLPDGRTGVGRAIGVAAPPPVHVLAEAGGEVTLDSRPLVRIAVRRTPFTVMSGDVRLAGEQVLPPGRPKGTLLLIHGSGDGPRSHYGLWIDLFLSQGWAVAVYDKRGSGGSAGDWHTASLETLAADARAVLDWARSRPELKGRPFGLWGVSQAGWVIPQLAASAPVDFAIVQAGPSIPVDQFVGDSLESELVAYGFDAAEIARARAYYELDAQVSRGQRPFANIKAAYDQASAAGAEWLLGPPLPADAPDRRFIAAISGFDPAPWWRRVHIPLLATFGGRDHVVPAAASRARLEALLREAGNGRAEIVTLAEDNHLNMLARTGVRTEYPGLGRLDPAYLSLIRAYLRKQAKASP